MDVVVIPKYVRKTSIPLAGASTNFMETKESTEFRALFEQYN